MLTKYFNICITSLEVVLHFIKPSASSKCIIPHRPKRPLLFFSYHYEIDNQRCVCDEVAGLIPETSVNLKSGLGLELGPPSLLRILLHDMSKTFYINRLDRAYC